MKSLPPELAAAFAAAVASSKPTDKGATMLPPGIVAVGGVTNTETSCTSLFVALLDGTFVGINTQGGLVKVGVFADNNLETLLAGMTYTPADADPLPTKPEDPAAVALAALHVDALLSDDDLCDKYGHTMEGHPSFPVDEWRESVAKGYTTCGYWQYVEYAIESALSQVE
jgi:hypothetical protein